MSIEISTLVWKQAPYRGARLLVLLALADATNQEGLCWPAMQTIAHMARCSARRAQEHISVLEQDGWVRRVPQPGRANWYWIQQPETTAQPLPDEPEEQSEHLTEGCESSQGSESAPEHLTEGCESSQGGVRILAGGGANPRRGGVRALAPRTIREPSENHQRTEEAPTRAFENAGTPEPENAPEPTPPPASPLAPTEPPLAAFRRAYPDVTAWARKTGRRWYATARENEPVKWAYNEAYDLAEAAQGEWEALHAAQQPAQQATG